MIKLLRQMRPSTYFNKCQVRSYWEKAETDDTEAEVPIEMDETERKIFRTNIETPELDLELANKIENIAALNVSKDLVTWMIVNKYGSIISWDHAKLRENKSKIVNFEEDYQELYNMFTKNLFRQCEAFVFESRRYKTLDIRFVPLMMKIHRQELMLQCLLKEYLNSLSNKRDFFKVFSLNREHVGKKFRIVVGNERTTSGDIVKHIMYRNTSDPNFLHLNDLSLKESREFKRYFKAIKETNIRESIAKNYIQASCFVKKLNYVKYFKSKDDQAEKRKEKTTKEVVKASEDIV